MVGLAISAMTLTLAGRSLALRAVEDGRQPRLRRSLLGDPSRWRSGPGRRHATNAHRGNGITASAGLISPSNRQESRPNRPASFGIARAGELASSSRAAAFTLRRGQPAPRLHSAGERTNRGCAILVRRRRVRWRRLRRSGPRCWTVEPPAAERDLPPARQARPSRSATVWQSSRPLGDQGRAACSAECFSSTRCCPTARPGASAIRRQCDWQAALPCRQATFGDSRARDGGTTAPGGST